MNQPRSFRYPAPLIIAALLLAGGCLPALAAAPPAARGERAMVVTSDEHASTAGLEVLRSGGNAIDAAVAVGFVLAVTFPKAGSIGGGGFLLYRDEKGTHHALDFRERAPAGLRPEMFLDDDGRPLPGSSLEGGLAVGVPGTLAGLAEMHRRWGSLPWKKLMRPAIRLADRGFALSPYMAAAIEADHAKLSKDPAAREIFMPKGRPPRAGELLVQKDLAATLKKIARRGPAYFYEGKLAGLLCDSIERAGGVMTPDDLAAYAPVEREPLRGEYRGHEIVSFPPPSSGGVALLQMLGMLEKFDLRSAGADSTLSIHLMAEAERIAFADRSRWLGDPDYFDVPVRELLSPDYLARRGAAIDPGRATPSKQLSPASPATIGLQDTLHFSIADAEGRAVSLTNTLNTSFGTGLVAGESGILLNNEIDDFALAPGAPNVYGLLGGEANSVAGGKRPLSSMTPTIVEPPGGGPRPLLVLGSPGGATIITSVLQVIINVIDHRMPLREAVEAPRFHHQWLPDRIRHEGRSDVAGEVLSGLEALGHRLQISKGILGNVNAIALDDDGAWLGAADSRREGSEAGY
jgi:gamma-glutamyltranspeptidase/glutathione hydrolase